METAKVMAFHNNHSSQNRVRYHFCTDFSSNMQYVVLYLLIFVYIYIDMYKSEIKL